MPSTDSTLPAKLAADPSVQPVLARRRAGEVASPPAVIGAAWLRELCLAAGVDDAAAVSLDHTDLAGEREHVLTSLSTSDATRRLSRARPRSARVAQRTDPDRLDRARPPPKPSRNCATPPAPEPACPHHAHLVPARIFDQQIRKLNHLSA
jgi:hypothetical protein